MTQITHVKITWLSRLTEFGPTGMVVRVVPLDEYLMMTEDELEHTHVENLAADEAGGGN